MNPENDRTSRIRKDGGRRRGAALLLAVLLLLSSASCFRQEAAAETGSSGFPCTFTDSTGCAVTLEERPQTVAVLFSSFAEIWTTAGGTVAVTVGESVTRGFAGEDVLLVDPSAGHTTIDLETLIASCPDLVIGTADYECQADAVEFCRSAGIPSALFRVESFSDYLEVLRIFCMITGEEERYESDGSAQAARIEQLLAKTAQIPAEDRPEILLVRAGSSDRSTKAKSSDDNFVCVMLAELGAGNIADADRGLTGELSLERIVEADPDYLFITTMGDEAASRANMDARLASDGWKDLTCVAGGSWCYLPKELFHFKPNTRWAEAYEYLAAILYPELF